MPWVELWSIIMAFHGHNFLLFFSISREIHIALSRVRKNNKNYDVYRSQVECAREHIMAGDPLKTWKLLNEYFD